MACVGDYRSAAGPVRWQFAPLGIAERRILAHLMAFHEFSTADLKAAKLVESEYSGEPIPRQATSCKVVKGRLNRR